MLYFIFYFYSLFVPRPVVVNLFYFLVNLFWAETIIVPVKKRLHKARKWKYLSNSMPPLPSHPFQKTSSKKSLTKKWRKIDQIPKMSSNFERKKSINSNYGTDPKALFLSFLCSLFFFMLYSILLRVAFNLFYFLVDLFLTRTIISTYEQIIHF